MHTELKIEAVKNYHNALIARLQGDNVKTARDIALATYMEFVLGAEREGYDLG